MIAVDIGDLYIKIAELERSDKGLRLLGSSLIGLEDSLFDQNEQLDGDRLIAYLKPDLSAMRSKDVVLSFSCMTTVSNDYTIPYEKNAANRLEMIKAKVFQNLSPQDYMIDCKVTSVFTEEGVQKCTVITYILPRNLVTTAYDCILALGKRPRSLDVSQNCAWNFAQQYIDKKSFVVVNLSAKKIAAHLINRPSDIITRMGGLSQELEQESYTGLFGLDLSAEASPVADNTAEELWSIVSKLIQYQAIKYPGSAVEAIYLTGSVATLQHAQMLTGNSDLPTCVLGQDWNPLQSASGSDFDIPTLFYSFGAALGGTDINFFHALDLENRRRIKKNTSGYRLAILVAILVQLSAMAGVLWLQQQQWARVASLQDLMAQPQVQTVMTEDANNRVSIVKNERGLVETIEVQGMIEEEIGFKTEYYNSVLLVKPFTVTIQAVSYQQGRMGIVCTTADNNPPADFAKALEGTGLFSTVGYNGFSQGETQTVTFTIDCILLREKEGGQK